MFTFSGTHEFQPVNVIHLLGMYTVPYTPTTAANIKITNYGAAVSSSYAPIQVVIMNGIPLDSVLTLEGGRSYQYIPGTNSVQIANTSLATEDNICDYTSADQFMHIYN